MIASDIALSYVTILVEIAMVNDMVVTGIIMLIVIMRVDLF